MGHPHFRLKLEAVGFGIFIPLFFVTTGHQFDARALFAGSATLLRVPNFLAALLVHIVSVLIFPAAALATLRIGAHEARMRAHRVQ